MSHLKYVVELGLRELTGSHQWSFSRLLILFSVLIWNLLYCSRHFTVALCLLLCNRNVCYLLFNMIILFNNTHPQWWWRSLLFLRNNIQEVVIGSIDFFKRLQWYCDRVPNRYCSFKQTLEHWVMEFILFLFLKQKEISLLHF